VAWAADDTLLPRAGERGFPHWGRWAERNKRFTRDIVQWFAQGAQYRLLLDRAMIGPSSCYCTQASAGQRCCCCKTRSAVVDILLVRRCICRVAAIRLNGKICNHSRAIL